MRQSVKDPGIKTHNKSLITSAMGNTTHVNRGSVPTDRRLRSLLQAARKAAGNLTQREAAARAGISAIRWQQIESPRTSQAPASTLAAMLLAVKATPGRLRDEGYREIADAMDDLASMQPAEVSAEDHLAATPGASAEEISALQSVWKALKAGRTPDPFDGELRRTQRSNADKK